MKSVNPSPPMTRHLVERKAFDGDPLVFLDVGAAGGIPAEWQVFGDQMRVYCFEPNEGE